MTLLRDTYLQRSETRPNLLSSADSVYFIYVGIGLGMIIEYLAAQTLIKTFISKQMQLSISFLLIIIGLMFLAVSSIRKGRIRRKE